MDKILNMNNLVEVLLRDPSEGLREEAVKITVDTGELLRLVYQDESADVRRAALEQLARLSDRLSADEREKLLHMVDTDFDALFPLGNRRIYGLRVCPDCGYTGLHKDFNESDPSDDAGVDREKAADGGSTAVWTCRRCGRKENHDFSVDRRDWLQGSFFYGSGRSDLVERIIEKEAASLREKLIETALHDKNWRARRTVVEKIDDEETLIRVGLQDGESHVRLAAVNRINDTETLLKIALHDESWLVRLKAVQRIDHAALSESDKKRFQRIYLHDEQEKIRTAAFEKINASGMNTEPGADKTSAEKSQAIYEKYGARKDAEPLFQPKARGLFLVSKSCKELTEDEFLQVNMHAQSVLKEENEAFSRAQTWWSNLPKTPDRQRENVYLRVSELDDANGNVREWIEKCNAYEGLVYIFSVERKLNLRTNETENGGNIPVVAFNMAFGFRTMEDIVEEECVTYRMYFAYFE